ncbi:MAG TPA: orotate phosphoribosyltransferase [Candidatus Saccharimonadales bacterium]|nr:orotate phosphoribosyltransferase [Candidatus Saccharimonadales bacterium]
MKSTNIEAKVASILYDIGCVLFRPKQPFRYASGILSPVYTDNRLIISHPKQREKIVDFLIEAIKEIGIPDVVAGTATAGIPHAAFIAQKLKIPMVYVRAKPKDHGEGNQVEGAVKRGQKAIVVEDLISTATSSITSAEALRKLGVRVTDVVAIFTYNLKEAEENLKAANLKLHALTNLKAAAEVAVKKGYLKEDQVEMVLDWAKDPRGWAKRMGME